MNFDALMRFQDSLEGVGIAGNDCAVYVDGNPVYRHFVGYQNRETGEKITDRTLYRMFSMTKPVVCAAALTLFEQGAFLLSDPVSQYLPEYGEMRVRTCRPNTDWDEGPAKNALRVQNLFEMTTGLDYDLNTPEIRSLREKTNDQFTTRELAAAIAKKTLRFEPGTHWLYGLSHDVLGALIEVVSGMTLGEYCRKAIFDPLGMKETWFHAPQSERGRCCQLYTLDQNGRFQRGEYVNHLQLSKNQESGGAGLTMTVDDYARFACMMTNRGLSKDGVRILSGRTVDLMRTNRLSDTLLRDYRTGESNEGYGYGLGVRTLMDPAASGSLSAVGEFGWAGAWSTYVMMDPANRVTLVYAEQGGETVYIHRRLRNIACAALEWEGLI